MVKGSRSVGTQRFEVVCATLDRLLGGSSRRDLCDALSTAPTLQAALAPLRERMCDHVWMCAGERLLLRPFVSGYDARTRADGFHALHDWDGVADTVNRSSIPVDVLDFVGRQRGGDPCSHAELAILIDYYFLYVLALLSLRIWDAGNPDQNLDRIDHLLTALQGPHGSAQRFADDAGTLMLIATSHYELEERGFGALLAKVRTLSARHQIAIALGHAAAMGCHLRFGYEATYGRDAAAMRSDNVADYPWLAFSLVVLLREYARMREAGDSTAARRRVVEAFINGLSADPTAFAGPEGMSGVWADAAEQEEFLALLSCHRAALAAEAEPHRPDTPTYSPLALYFNFSQNVLKGMVVDSLMWGEASPLSLNDMLTADGPEEARQARAKMAAALVSYARARPNRIRGQLRPVIVYDADTGRQSFADAIGVLRGA